MNAARAAAAYVAAIDNADIATADDDCCITRCSPPSTPSPTTSSYYSRKPRATIIPSPTVEHSLSEVLHQRDVILG
jgi:hypothetical protein